MYVTGPARPHGLRSLVPDLIRTDQALNKVSVYDTCFLAPDAINHDLALVVLVVMLLAGQQIARVIKQVVEVQKCCLPLIVGVQFCEGYEFGDELRKGTWRNRGYEGCISVAASIVMRLRRIGELLSACVAEAFSSCCILPCRFLPPSDETSFCTVLAIGERGGGASLHAVRLMDLSSLHRRVP